MEFDPRLTMKNDCYRTRNASATRESSVSRGSYYPDCRKDAQCNCAMCMDSMQATMDLRSPNNMCSSITDWSESPSRSYATPHPYGSAYSCASFSLYEGKENRCPKTEMSENMPRKENRRVSSMTVGPASKSGPDLSGYATDDGQMITKRKKNILFGDATDDGALLPDRSKPGNFYSQVAEPRKEMGLVGIAAHDESITAEIERNTSTSFGDGADNVSMKAEMERKNNLFGDAADYWSIAVETEGQKNIIRGEPTEDGSFEADFLRKLKILVDEVADRKRENTLFGGASDDGATTAEIERANTLFGDAAHDGSMTTEIERKKSLFADAADDGSVRARIERRNRSLFGDPADHGSITARVQRRNKSLLGDVAGDGSMPARVERRNQSLLGDAVVDGSMIARVESSNKGLLGDSAGDESMTASVESTNKSLFSDATDDRSITAVSRKEVWSADANDDGSIAAERRKKIWFGDPMDAGAIIAERRSRKRKGEGRTKCGKLGIILFLLLVEFILPWWLSSLFELSLTADKLKDISEESLMRRRLSDRLDFVARKLSRIVPGQVVNCTGSDSTWKLQQDGLLVYSHCALYSSMVEEVSLWGFPSQTAGVMGREITDRSFIIMSGRMIEWYEGKTDYVVHQEGDSWTHEMLTASVVQMDGKTWILEYRPAAILQGGGLVSWALRFLKWCACRICERVRFNFRSFLLPKLSIRHIHGDLRTPT